MVRNIPHELLIVYVTVSVPIDVAVSIPEVLMVDNPVVLHTPPVILFKRVIVESRHIVSEDVILPAEVVKTLTTSVEVSIPQLPRSLVDVVVNIIVSNPTFIPESFC